MRSRLLGAAAVAAALAAGLVPATAATAAPVRGLTWLDEPAGASHSYASAINNKGQIAGGIDDRPVVWDARNHYRYLDMPIGAAWAFVSDLNGSGVAVGTAGSGFSIGVQAVWWDSSGHAHSLASAETSAQTGALGINDRGDVVGWRGGLTAQHYPVQFINQRAQAIGFGDRQGELTDIAENGTSPGTFWTYNCACPHEAFEYGNAPPASGGVMGLAPDESHATAVTADGTRIAGTVNGSAAVWTLGSQPHTGYPTWTRTLTSVIGPGIATNVAGMSRSGAYLVGDAPGIGLAWIYRQGDYTQLAGSHASAGDVNDSGVAVGASLQGQHQYAVVWR